LAHPTFQVSKDALVARPRIRCVEVAPVSTVRRGPLGMAEARRRVHCPCLIRVSGHRRSVLVVDACRCGGDAAMSRTEHDARRTQDPSRKGALTRSVRVAADRAAQPRDGARSVTAATVSPLGVLYAVLVALCFRRR